MSQQHHFHLNAIVNTIAGNAPPQAADFKQFNDFLGALKTVADKQHKLIKDEYEELRDRGFAAGCVKEVRDGLGDVIVTLDGLLFRYGIPYTNIYAAALPSVNPATTSKDNLGTALYNVSTRLSYLEEALATLLQRLHDSNVGNLQIHRRHVGYTAEVIYTLVYGLAYDLGVDLDADQQAIYISNLTKFDTDPAVAEKGLQKYTEMGVEAALFPKEVDGVTYYVIKSVKDQTDKGRPYPAGKFLKSVLFQEPQLVPLADGALLNTLFS